MVYGNWLEEGSSVDLTCKICILTPFKRSVIISVWKVRSCGFSVSVNSIFCFWSVCCSSLGHSVCVDSSDLFFMDMCPWRLSFLLAGYS